METKIKTTGSVVLTEELSLYIEKKVKKLEAFLKGDPTAIVEIEVGTTTNGARTGDLYRAEVHATFTGGDVYADAEAEQLHPALNEAVGEARREVRRMRNKNRALVRRGAAQVKEFFRNFGK